MDLDQTDALQQNLCRTLPLMHFITGLFHNTPFLYGKQNEIGKSAWSIYLPFILY